MAKLLLVDCDGTIREPASGEKFIQHPLDQQIIAGADKGVAHYHKQGWTIIGISNQGGVAAGHKALEDAIAEQQYTLELFPQISTIYFCPDFEGRHCWAVKRKDEAKPIHTDKWTAELIGTFRKPQPGMLLATVKWNNAELKNCWYVGDRPEDETAANEAGINFMPADIWLSRFRVGIYSISATLKQIKFLEGIDLRRDKHE